jgi:hypothetical protein
MQIFRTESRAWDENAFSFGILTKIFEPEMEEVGCRKLHNGEFHNVHPSSHVVRDIQSRRMRRGHVAQMGQMRNNIQNIKSLNLKRRDHLKYLSLEAG